MSQEQDVEPKSAPISRLGRGLGRLIPITKPPAAPAIPATPAGTIAVAPTNSATAESKDRVGTPVQARAVSVSTPAAAPRMEKANLGAPAAGKTVVDLSISSIQPNQRQPRKDFDATAIEELAASIRSAGLLQPVIVRPALGSPDRFELIAGERRLRACKSLGWKSIPAIVTQATDQNAGVWALIENVHRADLNPMDRALSLKQLASEFRLTHEALSEQVGLDRSSVTNLLRMAELDESTAGMVRRGLLSQGHAKALLGVSSLKTRATLAESAVRGEWSVRALEREVQRVAEAPVIDVPRGTPSTRRRTHIDALERKLSQALGTDVKIQTGRKPNTGKLQIAFYSVEQFEGILSSLGIKPSQIRLED